MASPTRSQSDRRYVTPRTIRFYPKYVGDRIAWRLHREQGLPPVMIYPSAVVGPDDLKGRGRYIKSVAGAREEVNI
jgi:nucleoside-diphosphate-sugar epimerase